MILYQLIFFRNVLKSEHIDFFRRLLLNLDSSSSEGEEYNDTIYSDTFQYSYREGIFEIDVRLSNYYTCASSCDKEYIRELAEKIVKLYDFKKLV